jgi:hypothetical protein
MLSWNSPGTSGALMANLCISVTHYLFVGLFIPFLLFVFSGEERGVMQGEMHQTALEFSQSLSRRGNTQKNYYNLKNMYA